MNYDNRNIFQENMLDYSATVKRRPSAEYNEIKFSVLPPTQLVFTAIVVLFYNKLY